MSEGKAGVQESPAIRSAVKPEEIQVQATGSVGHFGKSEVETAAGQLVQYFQFRGSWEGFTLRQLLDFYKLKGWDESLMLFGLLGAWLDDGGTGGLACSPDPLLVQFPDGKFEVTDRFVQRCLKNGPSEEGET